MSDTLLTCPHCHAPVSAVLVMAEQLGDTAPAGMKGLAFRVKLVLQGGFYVANAELEASSVHEWYLWEQFSEPVRTNVLTDVENYALYGGEELMCARCAASFTWDDAAEATGQDVPEEKINWDIDWGDDEPDDAPAPSGPPSNPRNMEYVLSASPSAIERLLQQQGWRYT